MRLRLRKTVTWLLFIVLLVGILRFLYSFSTDDDGTNVRGQPKRGIIIDHLKTIRNDSLKHNMNLDNQNLPAGDIIQFHQVKRLNIADRSEYPPPNYDVHIFYYPWYGNPDFDGKYLHWNHDILDNWNKDELDVWPRGKHQAPEDIGSNYFPLLGTYSSRDPTVLENHMQQIRSAGVGVIAVSWYPPGQADEQGETWDDMIPLLMDTAHKYQIKVCFHIEPFKNRNALTLRSALEHIFSTHGGHPAFYRRQVKDKLLPLFYIYDSYLLKVTDWLPLLKADGYLTVRGTDLDAVFMGLVTMNTHRRDMIIAGFDGFYTYFASSEFTYGSTLKHWKSLADWAKENSLLFSPSVGPGYLDESIRPWNTRNTRDRLAGGYYSRVFQAAIDVNPPIISITSFNEWGEGTQIEMAQQMKNDKRTYLDYSPQSPDFYLALTKELCGKFQNNH